MIISLHIENIALIQHLEIDFSNGFHALTGETGAGKSILIDSIGLLIGSRGDKTLIRTGAQQAYVCALFGGFSAEVKDALACADVKLESDGTLLVERTLLEDGRSKVKLNSSPASLSKLKEIGKYLIDIHGQNDTYALYDASNYIRVLDSYASNQALSEQYRQAFEIFAEIEAQIAEITKSESERLRLIEMLTYQVADIDAVSPKIGEDLALQEKEHRIKNSERIVKQAGFAYRALKGGEKGNAVMLLQKSAQALSMLKDVIPDVEALIAELEDCRYRIDDVAEQAEQFASQEGGDPTTLINRIELRLDAIAKLKKKYGDSIEAILAYRNDAKARLDTLQNADDRLIALKAARESAYQNAFALAKKLHESRATAAESLSRAVVDNLVFLDMPKVTFTVDLRIQGDINAPQLGIAGFDQVDFLISANQGENMHSLSKVASGGELARIMLALKCVETDREQTTSMVFDEIDTGVSGKTARKIGLKLLELSKDVQVLCVTHSAQIASLADTHLLISKHVADGRTLTTVTALDEEGRIQELSRVLGGIHVTDAQRQAAIDMRKERA